ncbi:hypothetical protein C8R44DRAFT_786956 [Mycena epipterygia]|nr:hypothetical protein C8R44DRAFT_786956 [Mycena epipterygia]
MHTRCSSDTRSSWDYDARPRPGVRITIPTPPLPRHRLICPPFGMAFLSPSTSRCLSPPLLPPGTTMYDGHVSAGPNHTISALRSCNEEHAQRMCDSGTRILMYLHPPSSSCAPISGTSRTCCLASCRA